MRMKSVFSVLAPAVLLLQVSAASAVVCGDAYYNHEIDWPDSTPLYYSVAGAPPNTCGTLRASRNGGAYTSGANWICTDSNGNATKGPWSSNPDDETAYVYIDWGTCTSPVRKHIWDVGAPTGVITSTVPGTLSGTATDEAWGAGFNINWTACWTTYQNLTTGKYWNDETGAYSVTAADFVRCSNISGMPGMSITWSQSVKPDAADHVSGHQYRWIFYVSDGDQFGSDTELFTY